MRFACTHSACVTIAATTLDCVDSLLLRGFQSARMLRTCRLKVISENIFIASSSLKLYPTSFAETSLILVNHLDFKDPFVRPPAKECSRDLDGALDFDRQTPLYWMPGVGCRNFHKLGRAIAYVLVSNAASPAGRFMPPKECVEYLFGGPHSRSLTTTKLLIIIVELNWSY
ncbi:hypothetical protein VL15_12825 [Burkholderia cepacia]|uniref:Uncharacterized protein n=1 Tax=Burkholderia cepacia TaxID=292 RepID=A0A0J5X4X4_BURCE|nr:hypothetical protein VL15_12825 [Burkholderia cepacia]